jgi:hypothetical protein
VFKNLIPPYLGTQLRPWKLSDLSFSRKQPELFVVTAVGMLPVPGGISTLARVTVVMTSLIVIAYPFPIRIPDREKL